MQGVLLQLLLYHKKHYQIMNIRDIYKLVYQSEMGIQHYLSSPDEMMHALDKEFIFLPKNESALLVPVGIENDFVRVDIPLFKALGGKRTEMLQLMQQSAEIYHPNKKKLQQRWAKIGRLLQHKQINYWSYMEWKEFNEYIVRADFPAVHHSKQYYEEYSPCYRICAKHLILGTLPKILENTMGSRENELWAHE